MNQRNAIMLVGMWMSVLIGFPTVSRPASVCYASDMTDMFVRLTSYLNKLQYQICDVAIFAKIYRHYLGQCNHWLNLLMQT